MAILRRDILPVGQVLTNSGQVDGAVLRALVRRFDPTEPDSLRMAVYDASEPIEALSRRRPNKALVDKQAELVERNVDCPGGVIGSDDPIPKAFLPGAIDGHQAAARGMFDDETSLQYAR